MPTYENGSGQFEHSWKPGEGEFGERVEHSETPFGKYTVSKGRGKLKWAVNHEDGWEALGETRGQVRAEANLDLRDRANRKSE